MSYTPTPLRGDLPADVQAAARLISPLVWGSPYEPGRGVMHFASGPFWRKALLREADKLDRFAAAARKCAELLPDE